MKLTFLGSGSAFTVGSGNYHSNMFLTDDNGHRFFIDCGSDARWSTHAMGLSYHDITDVYVSHLHADHAGGLEWLAFSTKFDPQCGKPNLYICERLISDLWNKVLSGGLSSLQMEIATLETYFNVHPVEENKSFYWDTTELQIIQTIHVFSGFSIMPSYGLSFTVNNLKIFITTDTQFNPNMVKDIYQHADIIFHDCETIKNKSLVHTHYDELLTLPKYIRKKLWLYHYNPGKLPDAVKDGFRGFVKRGQVFDFHDSSTF